MSWRRDFLGRAVEFAFQGRNSVLLRQLCLPSASLVTTSQANLESWLTSLISKEAPEHSSHYLSAIPETEKPLHIPLF